MKEKFVFLLIFALFSLSQADAHRGEIPKERLQMSSNYYAYPTPAVKYTKAPAGYKPFYISH
jgi:hypothetical protein